MSSSIPGKRRLEKARPLQPDRPAGLSNRTRQSLLLWLSLHRLIAILDTRAARSPQSSTVP